MITSTLLLLYVTGPKIDRAICESTYSSLYACMVLTAGRLSVRMYQQARNQESPQLYHKLYGYSFWTARGCSEWMMREMSVTVVACHLLTVHACHVHTPDRSSS